MQSRRAQQGATTLYEFNRGHVLCFCRTGSSVRGQANGPGATMSNDGFKRGSTKSGPSLDTLCNARHQVGMLEVRVVTANPAGSMILAVCRRTEDS